MDRRWRRCLIAMTRSRNLTFSPSAPSSAAGGLAVALAPADMMSALAGAKVAPVATAAVDELVPVRAMSSLPPDSLGAMIPQPRDWGNSERAGCVGAVRRTGNRYRSGLGQSCPRWRLYKNS
jgi:hypothetical protein